MMNINQTKRWENPAKFYLHFVWFRFALVLLIVRKCLNLFSFGPFQCYCWVAVMFENSLATLDLHTGMYIFRYSLWIKHGSTRQLSETPCTAHTRWLVARGGEECFDFQAKSRQFTMETFFPRIKNKLPFKYALKIDILIPFGKWVCLRVCACHGKWLHVVF